jgi:hypothetical protein
LCECDGCVYLQVWKIANENKGVPAPTLTAIRKLMEVWDNFVDYDYKNKGCERAEPKFSRLSKPQLVRAISVQLFVPTSLLLLTSKKFSTLCFKCVFHVVFVDLGFITRVNL